MDFNFPDNDCAHMSIAKEALVLEKACENVFYRQLVVAALKSGWLWAHSPGPGDVHWSMPVGPGGTVGGLQWGSAVENSRIHVANRPSTTTSLMRSILTMRGVVHAVCPSVDASKRLWG